MGRYAMSRLSVLVSVLLGPVAPVAAQICPPAPGVSIPDAVREVFARWEEQKQTHPDAPRPFQFRRAWIGTTQRLAELRATSADEVLFPTGDRQGALAVGGTVQIPVFTVLFSNTEAEPYPASELERHLFGDGVVEGGITAFYAEMSGGSFDVQGTVRGWHPLPQPDVYYEGTSRGLNPQDARVGELIESTLSAWDAAVDFGQYDNDGPDGIPNSGDDDGYVDFVSFVHPEVGGECGGNDNIWSHRWVFSAWDASGDMPYQTDDPAAAGGTILVDEYTIQPALACDGAQMIEIGIFCHEVGHIFGVPDLYDLNGGASGVGHWCLMASGNWNTPASPAHMSAWVKQRLGWVSTVDVSWQGTVLTIPPVMVDPVVYELRTREDRWRRREECALAGVASLAVGLTPAEGETRGWAVPGGYGNGWRETVARDFHGDGTGPVRLQFRYQVESESGFDFAFALLEVDGQESVLAVYDGVESGVAEFDLAPRLGSSPVDYRVKFRFNSDASYSNEDGGFAAACAPFVLDDVSLVGGGESSFSDFESHRDGWYQPDGPLDNPVSEVWLLENRHRLGSDQHLHGEGLLIYHVDEEVLTSIHGNTGGISNLVTRGLVVEEADGRFDLLVDPTNRGDPGDVWPGSEGRTRFDLDSVPDARTNSGQGTPVVVEEISRSDGVITCRVTAGDPAPRVRGVNPTRLPRDAGEVTLDLVGEQHLRPRVVVGLVRVATPAIPAHRVEWLDDHVVRASFVLAGQTPGLYDVVVENPDGQTAVAAAAFEVAESPTGVEPPARRPDAFALAQNFPNPFNPRTTIRYEVPRPGPLSLQVFDARGRVVRTLIEGTHPAGYFATTWDGTDETGHRVASGLYVYRLTGEGFDAQRKMLLVE